ncbi:MAG: glycosyltransferase family 4 protein [Candidatus Methylumidiphilus sp.]
MRVLMVNYEFPPIGGGAATATLFLAKSVLAQGHEVCVLTGAIGDLRGWTLEDGIEVIRVPSLRKLKDRASILDMSSFALAGMLGLPFVVRRFMPDCAIVMFTIPCGHIGLALKKIWNIPYVVSLRGGDVPRFSPSVDRYHRYLRPFRHMILGSACAVVANSAGLAELAHETDPFHVVVIPNGVDCHFFRPSERDMSATHRFNFLFVGRFTSEQKNLARLLEELATLNRTYSGQFLFHVVGDGPERESLMRLALQLGLEAIVIWHGWIDREKLRDIYKSSDCLVNVSLVEGMSNVILEAMASGLPVIASAVRGNTETVIHGESGLLFDLGHSDNLQQMLRYVLEDRDAARVLGLRAREIAQTRFSWDSTAESYMAFFNSPTRAA